MLALNRDSSTDPASGVVSIVGDKVYLGNGTTADVIGSVDDTYDGTSGQKLRVNFASPFTNNGFETGDTTGWTVMEQFIDVGVTSIAGFTSQDTAVYPADGPNDDTPPASATYTVSVTTTGEPTEGTKALRLESTMGTAVGCNVVHGPAVYSDPFEADTGDHIYFDWRAFAGGDAYHVFGYIIDEAGNQTEALDTYSTTTDNTAWATKDTIIPAKGNYRFVFISGTYDATCGTGAGASLLIDNVKVVSDKATAEVAQAIAQRVTYANSSDDPPATRNITFTANSTASGPGSDTITINIAATDDAPTLDAATASYTNTQTDDTFTNTSGQFNATDPDDTTFVFTVQGSTNQTNTIDGTTYDQVTPGTYTTLHFNSTTGDYVLVPNDTAIESAVIATEETFTVTATSNTRNAANTLTVTITVATSAPGAPINLNTTPNDQTIELTWDPPTWLGGTLRLTPDSGVWLF